MTTSYALEDFINAAAEAVGDFAGQMLGADNPIQFNKLEQMKEEKYHTLLGSYLALNCGDQLIKVYFLSSEEVLMNLVKRMLAMSPDEPLAREDMIDAIKEIINIISGGIKCRLNDHVNGGILLGLPSFIEGKSMQTKENGRITGQLFVAGMPVFLSVETKEPTHH